MKIFWSWQSDTPGNIGRHFVKDALEAAINEIRDDISVDEPIRKEIHLDHDRKGVPGSPDLAATIFQKIKDSTIVVADVTPVGETKKGKKIMNPNVAIELGYALVHPGDSHLLMVLNEAWGGRESLPFDLSHKAGPIMYKLDREADSDSRSRARKTLTRDFKRAIADCLAVIEPVKSPEIDDLLNDRDFEGVYRLSSQLLRQEDFSSWRRLKTIARRRSSSSLSSWLEDNRALQYSSQKEVVQGTTEAVDTFLPVISYTLAAIECEKDKVRNQAEVTNDILQQPNWPTSGRCSIIEIPEVITFVYQSLHGALCMHSGQLSVAIDFVRSPVENRSELREEPLWQNMKIMGRSSALHSDERTAWNFLVALYERWSWLRLIFEEPEEYQTCLAAYYIALNIYEYVDLLATSKVSTLDQETPYFKVPTYFELVDYEIARRGFHVLMQDDEQVRRMWRSLNIDDEDFAANWYKWMNVFYNMRGGDYRSVPTGFLRRMRGGRVVHESLLLKILPALAQAYVSEGGDV